MIAGLVCFAAVAPSAVAAIAYDQNVTPDVIFGAGNANGAFTVDTTDDGKIEVGLRAKLRFDASNQAQNIFNSNGDGTYTFDPGPPPAGGFGFCSGCPTTPIWNLEWTVNVDVSSGTDPLTDYTYEVGIDFDPDPVGTNFLTFDPINQSYYDHAIGDNSTPNGGGTIAADATEYASLIGSNNVAQNSWNMEFFNDAPFDGFDPNDTGAYTVYLSVSDGGGEVARSEIRVFVGSFCGDGVIDAGEECDDGGVANGDGCSASCTVEPNFDCTGEPSVCMSTIPAVSEWGLLVLLLVGLAIGSVAFRRGATA